MPRSIDYSNLIHKPILDELKITPHTVGFAVQHTYSVVDAIDEKLVENDQPRLAELVELANLSAIIGNLFRSGFAKASNGKFLANEPHKYPDLLSADSDNNGLEIKVALETNKPKGHLVKPGMHMTIRYVLGQLDGYYLRGKENRGNVIWIWEVRIGHLDEHHFSFSNTEGDSGKTAVITSQGMDSLELVYCHLDKVPYSRTGSTYKKIEEDFTRK